MEGGSELRPIIEPPFCKFLRWIVGVVYPNMELVGLENLPEDAIVAEERLPFDHYTWCAWQMMDKKEVSRYAYTDFWQDKPKAVRWIFWLASKIIKYPAVYIMTHARTIPVYHDSRCLTTFRRSIEKLQDGYSLVIFPEGTRNKGEELTMLPFKEGAFKIATKTGCPIVPISMNNTAEIFENHFPKIKKTHVVLEYGTPIYPNELDKDVKKHIGSYVQNIMDETIHKNAALINN